MSTYSIPNVVASVLTAALAVCSIPLANTPALAQTTLKVWHGDPPEASLPGHKLTSPYQGGAQKFKEIVEAKTKGRYKIDIYSGGQLYNGEREAIESLKIGVLDLAVSATSVISGWEPTIGVLDLPFMFPNIDVARRVLDGPIGDEIGNNLAKHGIKKLAFADNTFRQLETRTKPILQADDIKNMKIRVMESRVFVAMFKALGANPTPMPFSEVYTGLQTGVLDGYEHPIFPYIINRVYEVAKYVTWTNHTLTTVGYLSSMKLWNSLTPADQAIFLEAAAEARNAHRKYVQEINEVAIGILKKEGVTFTDVDTSDFKKRMEPVYNSFEGAIGKALLDKVKNAK